MGDYRRTRRRLEKATEANVALQAQVDATAASQAAAANTEFMTEHARLQQFEVDAKARTELDARETIRKGNADAILAGVDAKQREDVALILAGMQQAKTINLYDETEGARAALLEKLAQDRPGWFTVPTGGPTGPTGAPGHGPDGTPVLGRPADQLHSISDEAWVERFNNAADEGPVRL